MGSEINGKLSINKNNNNGENCQREVLEWTASQLLLPLYHLPHLDELAESHPNLMPAHTPQLLLEISRHQEKENPEGREFYL